MNISNLKFNFKNIDTKTKIALRRLIHPIILKMMPSRRTFELKELNEKPKVKGPVLYILTHSTSHDAPIACECIKDHFYILIGKQPLEKMDEVFFNLNGCVVVDRGNKESEKQSLDSMVKLLKLGENIVMFSEQTWCIKPSTPINKLRRGWVKVAKSANVSVVPIALEYYEHTEDNVCYVKYGDAIIVKEDDDIIKKNLELEEVFATLKYDIWNQFPVQKRSKIDLKSWNEIIRKRNEEYPLLDLEKENQFIIGNNDYSEKVLSSDEYLTGLINLMGLDKNLIDLKKEKIKK